MHHTTIDEDLDLAFHGSLRAGDVSKSCRVGPATVALARSSVAEAYLRRLWSVLQMVRDACRDQGAIMGVDACTEDTLGYLAGGV